ncbi:hypothetical protein FF80_01885 [Devosia sp. LC5]|uniref:helix-turn-helix domain-containing protein n=1 Tax=Devosia sp. LC5 TaxID=1502724 RepID=UPI0004E42B98|nr:hypothetical protein FF80_01885 [Devosia sp. LC5]
MDQAVLAIEAKVSRNTIVDFEKGRRTPGTNNLAAIRAALETAGAVFLDEGSQAEGGTGVRLKTGFTPKVKLAAEGSHRGAMQRHIAGAPLRDEEDKK